MGVSAFMLYVIYVWNCQKQRKKDVIVISMGFLLSSHTFQSWKWRNTSGDRHRVPMRACTFRHRTWRRTVQQFQICPTHAKYFRKKKTMIPPSNTGKGRTRCPDYEEGPTWRVLRQSHRTRGREPRLSCLLGGNKYLHCPTWHQWRPLEEPLIWQQQGAHSTSLLGSVKVPQGALGIKVSTNPGNGKEHCPHALWCKQRPQKT